MDIPSANSYVAFNKPVFSKVICVTSCLRNLSKNRKNEIRGEKRRKENKIKKNYASLTP
jgi:hypothetical protein